MIQADRLLETFLTILRINSFYPAEDPVADVLRCRLEPVGVQFTVDEHRNLLGLWPGTGSQSSSEPILLCAHMDTVRPTEGMKPIVRDGAVHSDGSSVLGADDKAAVAAIVEAVEAVSDAGVEHPPAEVLFTVGEDVGHIGSRAFDVSPVRSRMAYVPDVDGPVGRVVLAASSSENVQVNFHGRAAHAGMDPENGRSAISMAAQAVHSMTLGRIDEETRANIGKMRGGEAPNIVPPEAEMVMQVRSLDPQKCRQKMDGLIECCQRAAADWEGTVDCVSISQMQGYRFSASDPIILRADSAIRSIGLVPEHTVTCGGSDANEFNAKGLPTTVISVGYKDIHTNEESMPIDQLNQLAELCAALILGR